MTLWKVTYSPTGELVDTILNEVVEILKLKIYNQDDSDCIYWTVAHEEAKKGWTTENGTILRLRDSCGRTVAHEQARHGWITNDRDILELVDSKGITVSDVIISRISKFESE